MKFVELRASFMTYDQNVRDLHKLLSKSTLAKLEASPIVTDKIKILSSSCCGPIS